MPDISISPVNDETTARIIAPPIIFLTIIPKKRKCQPAPAMAPFRAYLQELLGPGIGADQKIGDEIAVPLPEGWSFGLLTIEGRENRFSAEKKFAERRGHDMSQPRVQREQPVRVARRGKRQIEFLNGLPEAVERRVALDSLCFQKEVYDEAVIV